jgi:hypothetical protein
MHCKDRVRLLREFSNALKDASMASAALTSMAGTSALADYTVLLREEERTETKASKARGAYEQHILKHQCAASEIQT